MTGRAPGAGDARLVRLARLAAMLRDREAAALAACRRKAAALDAEARALQRSIADPAPSAFNRAGRLQAQEAWRAAEIRRVNTHLARTRAQEADCADRAARAFARAEVLDRLVTRAAERGRRVKPPA